MWTLAFNLGAKLLPTGAHLGAHLLAVLVAIAVAFVPLFNLLGYESAALFGVFLGFTSLMLTIWAYHRGELPAPLDPTSAGPALLFGRFAVSHLALMGGPLVILVLNGLRVPNCDWGVGAGFWFLIVPMAILLGQGAAFLALCLTRRKALVVFIALAIPLLDGLAMGLHLAMEPPIIGHQWFLGYFGGSIYDEALAIPESLLFYRGIHLLGLIAFLAALQATFFFRKKEKAFWVVALAVGTSLACFAAMSIRKDFGIALDSAFIQKELGAVVETEHFRIYHPDQREFRERLDELIDDHEFRYHQLREFFQTDPVAESGKKIESYVYGNRESKGRLMGGRDTLVAKIWLGEMHILWRGPGDHLLTHELAHLFTEPFGSGPLRLSMYRGIGVNMGLVEGVAAAAEWPTSEHTPHEATAAMRELGIAPDLRRILGASGFWTQASGRAYTAMGSFVRFLIDRDGIETFKAAYGRGNFLGAYGVEVDALIGEWERFLDEIELTDHQREVARFRFDRTSIFARECARARAEARRLARNAAARGAQVEAQRSYEEILASNPADFGALQELIRLLREMALFEEALALIESRPREQLSKVQEAQFLALQGDLLWEIGASEEAARTYEEALSLGVTLDLERALLVKRSFALLDDPMGLRYLVGQPGGLESMSLLYRWLASSSAESVAARQGPESSAQPGLSSQEALIRYLKGRRYWQSRLYGLAVETLEGSIDGLTEEVLQMEAHFMVGQSYYFQGAYQEARSSFERLSSSERSRYRGLAQEWLDRVNWAQE